jgi:hypothetical protein
MTERDKGFYAAWAELLGWLQEYAAEREGARFVKLADFTDYIYRMERPYDLPTTIMSANLSDARGEAVLIVTASQRAEVFKEVILHPADSSSYRHLKLNAAGSGLAEGKRDFTREMLFELADRLFAVAAVV